jgi:hypothetical protein
MSMKTVVHDEEYTLRDSELMRQADVDKLHEG